MGEEKNKGSWAATEDPLQGRDDWVRLCEKTEGRLSCFLPWSENHVVPVNRKSKVHAKMAMADGFSWFFVLISCYFRLLSSFLLLCFWLAQIFFCGYSCARLANNDPVRDSGWIIIRHIRVILPSIVPNVFLWRSLVGCLCFCGCTMASHCFCVINQLWGAVFLVAWKWDIVFSC